MEGKIVILRYMVERLHMAIIYIKVGVCRELGREVSSYCGEDGLSTRGEFGGGPRSKTGSRSRREREHVREGAVVKSGRGRSEAAGTRAKGDDLLFDSGLHYPPLLAEARQGFI